MVDASSRTTLGGPTFIRLLARLSQADAPTTPPSLTDRLSRWLDWNHAVELSTALDGARAAEPQPAVDEAAQVDADACATARAALAKAITDEPPTATPPVQIGRAGSKPVLDTDAYAPYRKRYVDLQRRMQATTGQLRGLLREQLAEASPGSAQLARVDAVMEMALSPREQTLLAGVPELLSRRFEQLRQAAEEAPTQAALFDDDDASEAWHERFAQDMRTVLLAELDIRFQPVDALLAALRTRPMDPHAQDPA
ncbi:DUF3348 domain-containing protein [Oleiagrimonas sp. C23AA]|uniref:DUF3348 domain-containing protein n=1 Tax=Oleiagrimonas sp. C23AA TaxID=2719047 RepID=UPI0014236D5C|nr:DUF3348 domain-containing protein [Oleiagrimonas sp. C23AA]NII09114.1 DUF3348 domain-containing protein [Oleiagrimonas sp. C23AA]